MQGEDRRKPVRPLSPVLVFLLCLAPSLAGAGTGASLRATYAASAIAHNDEGQPSEVLTPGAGSLTITVGVTASEGVPNPTPPPESFAVQALGDAIGVARYGSLSGVASAEASSLPANLVALSRVLVNVKPGYTDVATVLSDTLPAGTPVTVTFRATLDATALHFVDPPNGVGPTGAGALYEIVLRDLDDLVAPVATRTLAVDSTGTAITTGMVQLATEIGHQVEIKADLTVGARVDVDLATYEVAQGTADAEAGQTAELLYEPSGDVRIETESGHTYAVPEPGRAALLTAGAVVLALGRARRRAGR
jgi:hypothetical protein